MQKFKRSIAWKQWVDPLLDIENFKQLMREKNVREGLITEEEAKADSDKEEKTINGLRILNTPFGILPLNEHNLPSNNFDFWIGYANFNIDNKTIGILNNIPGIEILDVFSRYTFKIGIGRHPDFTFRSVRALINEALCDPKHDKEDEILNQMNALQDKIKHNPAWAILAFPNGSIQSITADNPEDENFKQKLSLYKELALAVQAIIASHEDKNQEEG